MKRRHNNDKELTELQMLKNENRNLRSENRNLKKQLKRLQRKEHSFQETQYEDPEEIQLSLFESVPERCPECGKGEIVHINVVGRTWSECSQCDYRTKTVKI